MKSKRAFESVTRIRRIAPPYVAQFAFVVLSISIKLVGVSTLPAHGSGPKGADASKFNPLADHVWAWSAYGQPRGLVSGHKNR